MTIKEIEIQEALGTLSTGERERIANNRWTSMRILYKLANDKNKQIKDYAQAQINWRKLNE